MKFVNLCHSHELQPASAMPPLILKASCDADWAYDVDDRKSMLMIGGPHWGLLSSLVKTLSLGGLGSKHQLLSLVKRLSTLLPPRFCGSSTFSMSFRFRFLHPSSSLTTKAQLLSTRPSLHSRSMQMLLDIFFVR